MVQIALGRLPDPFKTQKIAPKLTKIGEIEKTEIRSFLDFLLISYRKRQDSFG